MKVKNLEILQNKRGLKRGKWLCLSAPGNERSLSGQFSWENSNFWSLALRGLGSSGSRFPLEDFNFSALNVNSAECSRRFVLRSGTCWILLFTLLCRCKGNMSVATPLRLLSVQRSLLGLPKATSSRFVSSEASGSLSFFYRSLPHTSIPCDLDCSPHRQLLPPNRTRGSPWHLFPETVWDQSFPNVFRLSS